MNVFVTATLGDAATHIVSMLVGCDQSYSIFFDGKTGLCLQENAVGNIGFASLDVTNATRAGKLCR